MNGVAYGLIGAAKVACNRGGGLALGTGEEYLTTTDRTGGRGPEPGLQGSPLVRRERAHKSGCLHTQEYTICPKTSIGSALGTSAQCSDVFPRQEEPHGRARCRDE